MDARFLLIDSCADNVALVMSYFSRQHSVDQADIRKYLDIGEDFEDIA